jgi:hypothetical protein
MMNTRHASERRASARQLLALPAHVEVGASERGMESLVLGQTRNISNRGAYILVTATLQVGQRLRLTLDVPPQAGRGPGLEIPCEAEVVRVEPAGGGEPGTGVALRVLRFETPKVSASPPWVN